MELPEDDNMEPCYLDNMSLSVNKKLLEYTYARIAHEVLNQKILQAQGEIHPRCKHIVIVVDCGEEHFGVKKCFIDREPAQRFALELMDKLNKMLMTRLKSVGFFIGHS